MALTTPLFLAKSPSGPYFLFAACLRKRQPSVYGVTIVDLNLSLSVLTSVVCILYVPETLGRSLNDVDQVWNERQEKTSNLLAKMQEKTKWSKSENSTIRAEEIGLERIESAATAH